METMKGKISLVIGANAGIDKATTLGLAKTSATIVMVCRSAPFSRRGSRYGRLVGLPASGPTGKNFRDRQEIPW